MGIQNVKVFPFPTSQADREWQRFATRTRQYWATRNPEHKTDALAALERFRVVFRAVHGNASMPTWARGGEH